MSFIHPSTTYFHDLSNFSTITLISESNDLNSRDSVITCWNYGMKHFCCKDCEYGYEAMELVSDWRADEALVLLQRIVTEAPDALGENHMLFKLSSQAINDLRENL